jgi:hypothetical protein
MAEIELNSNGVNKAIKATILSDKEMREIGFTDYAEDRWYFSRYITFPKERGYHGYKFEVSFNVGIPKDGSDIQIDILDEAFLQAYDYQYILDSDPEHKYANIVKEQVEMWMRYLQDNKVLSGHNYGDYI